MGRRKIQIQPIKDERNRKVTFVKRKAGLFKKAHELAVLCQVDLAVVILGHNNNKFYEYSSVGIQDLLQNFENKSFTHDVKEPKDYGDYELISRVKGTVSGANGRHQRSISAVSASIDGDHDEDDDDLDEDDEDDDDDDDSTPPTKRRKTIKNEATSSSRPSTTTSRRSNSRSSQPSQSNLSSVVPVSVPNKQQLQHQLPMQQTFPVSQNIPFDFQQQFRPQIIQHQHQHQQQQYAQQAQGFAEVVPVSHSQSRPQFTSPPSNNNVPVNYNPDTIPFLNQLSPISSFVMNGSMGMSPFARMTSTQPLSSNDRARRLNNNISKRPPLRVEIPDSTNFTLPPRSNDFTRVNIQPPTDQSQAADNKDSAATVTAPDTSKLTGNIVPKPIDQTGPAGEGTSADENKSFDLPGISSPIKLTPISATLPSALTGQFNLPLPQPNKPPYQSSTQFTPNQSFNNSGIGLSGGLKAGTSFNRSAQAGENTPVNVFATRIVPDVYDSPSNFFASDSWANAQFGTGNTPFPYSALPTGSNNNNNNTSHQLPIPQHNQQQNAISSDLKSSSTALSSGLRITTNSNGGASLVKPGEDEVGNATEGNSGESK
ncbi:hypothetical protein WICPIJ_000107 [Wickerhamomyces pijperi]|uniref:MADS-box domain-containing protein n=1 Tax=Wickerhamomyces pijperi TaxID=599730 RepID=A0A9P8QHT9_WICPI|nr:hypothetical protein WICPIJ_000107 [Wickerhamomyces pijperi]